MSLRFPKREKLKSRKAIEALFLEGHSITKFPVKVFYMPLSEAATNQAAFAVPKRNFKSAVDRNKIKRQLREAYRLQKQLLPANNGPKFALLFLYINKEQPQYAHLENSMRALLNKIIDENN
ncbi:ribonuclease P protein component [Altibacter sp.]|uniref:ribonuclease P protein component n=1 Tax=Altibacter sp. TaxID=2024823 RepID=UPI000C95BCF1|nr:ribonuclease P protein component [Altibacter sp.]MAP55689.1 ribonuclease P protein component [Altibacter sp.]|tara:strand:+ start:1346 stop:1711 length:366 start_codon:yes stop_codon:yes gene_type:complete